MTSAAFALYSALVFLFGAPEAAFRARVHETLTALCPATDPLRRSAYATVVTRAALEADPELAAATLLGIGAHETCFATEVQADGGPAVSAWQEEPRGAGAAARAADRAALLADPHLAAGRALAIADGCGLRCYATGSRHGGGERGAEVARQLATCVASARRGLAGGEARACRSWYKKPSKKRRLR